MKCRNCSSNLNKMFVDLGTSPPSNSYITKNNLLKKEKKYPLKVFVCENCWLVQTQDFTKADQLFDDNYNLDYSRSLPIENQYPPNQYLLQW